MGSHFEAPRGLRASLPEEVQQTAAAILKLLDAAGGVPNHVRAEVRDTCERVSRKLGEGRLTIALVGDAGAGRRTLVNALLGDRVLPTKTPRRGPTVTLVRRASALEFSALSLDGRSVARLSRKMPDRQGLFEKQMRQIDRERAEAEALAARLHQARQRVAALDLTMDPRGAGPASRVASLVWLALWSWILRLIFRLSRTKRLLSPETDREETPAVRLQDERAAVAAMERELAGTRTVEQIAVHAQRLQRERQKYEDERRAVFLSQVHDFDGTDIGERIVEYPAKHLPEGLTLMDVPCAAAGGEPISETIRSRVVHEADGLVVVSDVAQPPGDATASLVRALSDEVPVVLVVLTKADAALRPGAAGARSDVPSGIESLRRRAFDRVVAALGAKVGRAPCVIVAAEAVLDPRPELSTLADHFYATMAAPEERFRRERTVVVARREALRLRAGVAAVSRAQAREEELSRKRLTRLESNRIPDPTEFRRQLLDRLDGSIDQGADQVLTAAIDGLHTAIERLRSGWKDRIASSSARGEVDACIAAIDESAAGDIAAALEQTAEIVARELHEATERLQAWAIEEIHSHYRLIRRLGAEALTPVASELTREDLEQELLAAQPFGGAREAFEKQRVGLGLGGVAAGAALGTLIAPGIGTALGAVLGVFAGLLKGTDSLRQECLAKIDARLNETERHARAQLQGKRSDVSRVIRVALGEALEEAFGRLNEGITRLMTVERKALDRERAKLAGFSAARVALDECEERLVQLAEVAQSGDRPTGSPGPSVREAPLRGS